MTDTATRAEIRRKGNTGGFDLVIDGTVFPWHIARDAAEVTGGNDTMHVLRIGIVVVGPVIGADQFNEYLAEEADASRVRSADHRDMLNESCPNCGDDNWRDDMGIRDCQTCGHVLTRPTR